MSRERDEPVYYREVQKNGYLKRLPADCGGGRLRPLGHKRAPPEAMWTVLCVHNGRAAYLEQYAAPEAAAEHRPAWRASLQRARHVTASVRPWPGDEYDFLVAAEPSVRMLAPNWEVMQEWVSTLRTKLHELKLLERGENVYCAPPVPPQPRAGTRDPTSPLPPTPAGPAVRVPGIEPIVATSNTARGSAPSALTPAAEPPGPSEQPGPPSPAEPTEPIQELPPPGGQPDEPARERPTDWDAAMQLGPLPAGREPARPAAGIARICGQNVCLDDSILRRSSDEAPRRRRDSDEEFFAEIDRMQSARCELAEYVPDEADEAATTQNGNIEITAEETVSRVENVDSCGRAEGEGRARAAGAESFAHRVLVSADGEAGGSRPPDADKNQSATNITVIQVSNHRAPPHTAIPVVGTTADVFDFEFKRKLSVADAPAHDERRHFVNIVHTEDARPERCDDSPYGHISLATTVELSGEKEPSECVYERLCMASTSDGSPAAIRRTKGNLERLKLTNGRKSSLPNLNMNAQCQSDANPTYECLYPANNPSVNKNINVTVKSNAKMNLPESPTINANANSLNINVTNRTETSNSAGATNLAVTHSNAVASANTRTIISTECTGVSNLHQNNHNAHSNVSSGNVTQSGLSNTHSIAVNGSSNASSRSVERSQSQNSYDANVRLVVERTRGQARGQQHSPRREAGPSKNEAAQQEGKSGRGLFRRGLTELSFLSRLKGLAQGGGKPPPREPARDPPRAAASPAKVTRRARPDARAADAARRRSSSFSGGELGGGGGGGGGGAELQSLRARQVAALRAEQARGAAVAARLARQDAKREPPVLCDAHGVVWVAWWGRGGAWFGGRAGDRVAAVRGVRPRDAAHARQLLRQALSSVTAHTVDVLFHRVPHAKIFLLHKEKETDSIGIKLDGECGIVSVEAGSAAARAGLPPAGPRWAVTEVNNRPLDLLKGGEEEMARLSGRGGEVSLLLQPLPLVHKLRSALKTHRLLHAVGALTG